MDVDEISSTAHHTHHISLLCTWSVLFPHIHQHCAQPHSLSPLSAVPCAPAGALCASQESQTPWARTPSGRLRCHGRRSQACSVDSSIKAASSACCSFATAFSWCLLISTCRLQHAIVMARHRTVQVLSYEDREQCKCA